MNRTLQQQLLPQKLNLLLLFAIGISIAFIIAIYFNFTNKNITSKVNNLNFRKEIQVYSVLGSRVAEYRNINLSTFTINNLIATKSGLFLKIVLDNDGTVMKRIVY